MPVPLWGRWRWEWPKLDRESGAVAWIDFSQWLRVEVDVLGDGGWMLALLVSTPVTSVQGNQNGSPLRCKFEKNSGTSAQTSPTPRLSRTITDCCYNRFFLSSFVIFHQQVNCWKLVVSAQLPFTEPEQKKAAIITHSESQMLKISSLMEKGNLKSKLGALGLMIKIHLEQKL